MSLVAKYKKQKRVEALKPIVDGIALHERALADLKIQEKKLAAAYNARGFALAMARRRELNMDNTDGKIEVLGVDGGKMPVIDGVSIDGNDLTLKRISENLDFTRGEIVRIEQKLQKLRNYLKTQEVS